MTSQPQLANDGRTIAQSSQPFDTQFTWKGAQGNSRNQRGGGTHGSASGSGTRTGRAGAGRAGAGRAGAGRAGAGRGRARVATRSPAARS